jgi:outer membrane PBP1 activator LpoA protein
MRCGVLHRWLVVPLAAAALLYGGVSALASEPDWTVPESAVPAPAPPPPELEAPVPLAPGAPTVPPGAAPIPPQPAAAPQVPVLKPAAAPDAVPHIALLLPLESKPFLRHAEAVRAGFLAAAKVQGGAPPVRTYAVGDDPEQAVSAYIRAVNAGARVVVGPLTRSGVTAVMNSAAVVVPTLALNVPDGAVAASEVFMLSLQLEAEARQVAQLAWQDGTRKVITVYDEAPLYRRMHQAFVDEFARLGGVHAGAHVFTTVPEELTRIKKAADTAGVDAGFLALDFSRARLARPYLGALPTYATSQVNPGDTGLLAGFDLAGVRFLDMPWLLQPEHPAVMAYPRPAGASAVELDRFYALGIDAFRVALGMLSGRADGTLDGVTGRLTLGPDRQFYRGLTAAQFTDGKLTVRPNESPR